MSFQLLFQINLLLHKFLSQEKINDIKNLIESGMIQTEIAEKYGITRQAISATYIKYIKNK